MDNQKRNLNPTAEAIVAMLMWSDEYSKQNGGSMDFYDSLSFARKKQCIASVHSIIEAAERVKQNA